MYSLVMMAAMTATPDVPQEFLCPVSPSKYGGGYFSKHCFYDCCLPARYGWVNCWNKGFGYYPGGSRGFCGSCATASYGNFYNPSCCNSGCGAGSTSCGSYGFAGCSTGCGSAHGLKDWGIGCKPAYWTGVAGCKPCVTAPPYAHYTQKNPCCTYGHFAFDTGLIGHSSGVGYSGFGGFGNYGFYGAGPIQHPLTVADIPKYQPQDFMPQEARPYVPAREYEAPGYFPAPASNIPPAVVPEAPKVPAGPGGFTTPPPEKVEQPLGNPGAQPPLPSGLPEIPKAPNVPIVPAPAGGDKKDLTPPKNLIKPVGLKAIPSTVVLSVPAGATVYVEGVPLRNQSAERTFRTPALEPGREYAYTVKAIVTENGLEHTEVRQVIVIPGETSTVSLEKLLAKFGAPLNAVTQTGGK